MKNSILSAILAAVGSIFLVSAALGQTSGSSQIGQGRAFGPSFNSFPSTQVNRLNNVSGGSINQANPNISAQELKRLSGNPNIRNSRPHQTDVLELPLQGQPNPRSENSLTQDAEDGENLMEMIGGGPEQWTKPKKLSTSIQVMVLLTVLTLAPSILLMTTCFVRVIVVLGLLRQAIGAQQLPPSQVITALSIFITILVMAPVWNEIKNDAIVPYTQQEGNSVSLEQTINRGVRPLKRFMSQQIAMARNVDDIWLFHKHLPEEERKTPPKTFDDVPFKVLLPAYMISELKVAFLLGFQIYLPFLVIDIVVSSIAISMGMMMLPPVIISLPFKLILFVLVDGWHLVVGMLMASFTPYS